MTVPVAMDLSLGPGLSGRLVTWWDGVSARCTVVARATFELGADELAVFTTPRSVEDEAPWKALADVSVVSEEGRRALLGLSVARGTEVLLSKRTPDRHALRASVCTARETSPEGWPIVARDADAQMFQCAPVDQRIAYLHGGEQVLLVGFDTEERVVRLPALTAHAVVSTEAGTQQLALAGDRLDVDLRRGEVSVTWRGVVEGKVPESGAVAVSLVPTRAIEEVVGSPPCWSRTRRVRGPDQRERIDVLNDTPWVTTSLCTMLAPNRWRCTVIAKGTYDIVADAPATLADEQEPLWGDTLEGDQTFALSHASDLAPVKPKVDVLLRGRGGQSGRRSRIGDAGSRRPAQTDRGARRT